jgi:glucose-6-phosphate 1-dehydrogenase
VAVRSSRLIQLGTGGRGGYFDGVGIIRDIIQNHLLQAFMFLAMEPPADMSGDGILAAKVELLKAVRPPDLHDGSTFLGQYGASEGERGYLDDETVPAGSRCPTFAGTLLRVDNERWRGVPFLLSAGKGLDERLCELRVRFKAQPYNRLFGGDACNELVMRVQPDEALYLVADAKQPGISAGLGRAELRTPVAMGLRYATQFGDGSPFVSGDAYERMLLNAARGDQALSVSSAELTEAWRIFTPLLRQIDDERPMPVLHAFGEAPEGYAEWARGHGVDVEVLKPSWGGKQAEEALEETKAAHAAAQAAAQAAAAMQAARESIEFGY